MPTLPLLACALILALMTSCSKEEPPSSQNQPATATPATAEAAAPALPEGAVRIKAKLASIPGTFPANDIYNYAYVMRYEVVEVLGGAYAEKDILVAHYNPRIPRSEIKDDLDAMVDGNVTLFSEGDLQVLTLKPIETVYTGAIEDEFFQDKRPRWFAIQADKGN